MAHLRRRPRRARDTRRSIRSTPATSTSSKWRGGSRPTTSGPRPEYNYPVHAADGRRRALHHRRHRAARSWRSMPPPASSCGCTARTKASAARKRRGGCRDAACPTGPTAATARILYVTPGYRMIALDAKTGQRGAVFGKDGVVDLKLEDDQEMDPVHRRHRPARGAAHRQGHHHHRRGAHRGQPAGEPAQRQGLRARLRRAHRQAAVDLPHHSAPGRVRLRHLAAGLGGVHRQHRRVGADERRRGAGHRVPAGRDADRRLLRRPSAGLRPLRREPGRAGREDRQAQVALPVHQARHLGLGPAVRADPGGRDHRRQAAQDRRRSRPSRAGCTCSTA